MEEWGSYAWSRHDTCFQTDDYVCVTPDLSRQDERFTRQVCTARVLVWKAVKSAGANLSLQPFSLRLHFPESISLLFLLYSVNSSNISMRQAAQFVKSNRCRLVHTSDPRFRLRYPAVSHQTESKLAQQAGNWCSRCASSPASLRTVSEAEETGTDCVFECIVRTFVLFVLWGKPCTLFNK